MTATTVERFEDLSPLATRVLEALISSEMKLATAESCTGGLISAALTEIPGSSAVVDRAFVTYSNEAKSELLGVPTKLIDKVGAVSKEVAIAMAEGALSHSRADVAVSVTGVAGPGGGSKAKPVGTVHIAIARTGHPTQHIPCAFEDRGRNAIRLETVTVALNSILNAAN